VPYPLDWARGRLFVESAILVFALGAKGGIFTLPPSRSLFLPADSGDNCSIATTPATPPIHASLDYGRSMCLRSRKTLKS